MPPNKAKPPQRGAVTHHHDQLITLVNFNTRNVINKRPVKPTPPLVTILFVAITSIL
jgi:hypothetical protein